VLRLSGQLRTLVGPDRVIWTGWDMTAALALGAALGVPPRLSAEFLPDIEDAVILALLSGEAAELPEDDQTYE